MATAGYRQPIRQTRLSRTHSFVLLFLKSLTLKFQRLSVFGDRPDYMVGGTVWNFSFNLQRDTHSGTDETPKMGDHLLGDTARVSPHPIRVEFHGSVIAPWFFLGDCR